VSARELTEYEKQVRVNRMREDIKRLNSELKVLDGNEDVVQNLNTSFIDILTSPVK